MSSTRSKTSKPATLPSTHDRDGASEQPAAVLPFTSADSQRAYDTYVPVARPIPESEVQTPHCDLGLAYENVVLGVGSVLAREADLKRLPLQLTASELRGLPDLALAVGFAAGQINRRSPGQIADLKTKLVARRRLLFSTATMLVENGDVPRREVADLKKGRGVKVIAEDCVVLAALLRRYPAALKKTAVTSAQLDETAELATHLLTLLRQKRSKRLRHGEELAAPAVAIRNRLWTLLLQRHRELRRLGMWLFVDEVDKYVPPLCSSRRSRAKEPDPLPPPAPTPAEPSPATP